MAGTFGASGDDEPIAGINVTPLVDVVLVLLVIFMITAPALYQSAIKVQLPKAKTGEQASKTALTFVLNKDGELRWNQEKITWETLTERLKNSKISIGEETAVISADEATPHGIVIRLMDHLRDAGLTHFALNVEGANKVH